MSLEISVYTIRINDKKELLAAYMPFIKNGGIFLKSAQLPMGSSVAVVVEIPNDERKYAITGKVVWVSQKDTRQEGGVGLQFQEGPESAAIRNIIDILLAGLDRLKEKTMTI